MTESRSDSTPDFPAAVFSRRLVRWYQRHQRTLPWRETQDPYAILVSEVMLQQTAVAKVMGYYGRFLDRFPTVTSLATAPQDEVLALWSGLGYYRRARNLQAAARVIAETRGGRVPRTLDELMALPGIGRYTAGAILSSAFDEPVPIVEANSARVLARLFALRMPLKAPATARRLWRLAEHVLSHYNPREHNYALMELGSLVCRPAEPDCLACPVSAYCAAFRTGKQSRIPVADAPVTRIYVGFVSVVPVSGGRVLVARVPDGEWHAGMFEFPKVPVASGAAGADHRTAAQRLLRNLGLRGHLGIKREFRYAVTRHSVTLHAWIAISDGQRGDPGDGMRWVSLEEAAKLPLGSAQRRVLAWVSNEQPPGDSKV